MSLKGTKLPHNLAAAFAGESIGQTEDTHILVPKG